MVHAPLLSQLARDTHGLLLVHRGFGPCLGPSLKAGLGRCFGTSAVLDCYVSDGLRLVQWLGHVEVLQVGGCGAEWQGSRGHRALRGRVRMLTKLLLLFAMVQGSALRAWPSGQRLEGA